MKIVLEVAISLVLLAQAATAQSLGDLARQDRERRAKQGKPSVQVTTDEVKGGKLDLSSPLDPARKGDLDYLLQRLSHPKVTPELLTAFVLLRDRAIPKLLPMLGSTDPLKRVAPATVLIVLGNTEGLGSMARMLNDATEAAASVATSPAASPEGAFRQQLEAARTADFALNATKLGVWRFTEGSMQPADLVVRGVQQGAVVEIVGGADTGQKIFNRALRDKDPNLRRGAIALIRVAAGGRDFGFQPEQTPDQNESAIQQINTFLATERAKVVSELGTKTR